MSEYDHRTISEIAADTRRVRQRETQNALERRRKALESALQEIDAYLDTGTSDTSIHQGSIFHTQIKEILGGDDG